MGDTDDSPGNDAQDRAAKDAEQERFLAFLRDAIAPVEIATTDDLERADQALDDAMLAHVLATNPLAPRARRRCR
jgi:hypothetical protein